MSGADSAAFAPAARARSLSSAAILLRSAAKRLSEAKALAISSAFSVMALSIFSAAASSPHFQEALPNSMTAITLFMVASVMIAIFVALSGWFYAESYLRKRKRELATWMLLGMRKRTAALVVSSELGSMALIALGAGLGLGLLFSRFFALVLAALMSERVPIPMSFGSSSLVISALACAAQWAASSLRAAAFIARSALSDLIKADRRAEPEPRRRIIPIAAGCVLLAAGYYGAAFTEQGVAGLLVLPVLLVVVIGTFLCFSAAVPALVSALRKRFDRRDAAMLASLAQLSFRSRRNARLTAFSAILIAVASTAFGTVLSFRNNDREMSRRIAPHDLELRRATPEDRALAERILAQAGIRGAAGMRLDLEWVLDSKPEGGKESAYKAFPRSSWDAALDAIEDRKGAMPPVSSMAAPDARPIDDARYAELRALATPEMVSTISVWDGLPAREVLEAMGELKEAFGARVVSRADYLREQSFFFGLLLFIGAFMAAVFTLAAASLTLFRSMEDAAEDGDRYRSMIRLGAPRDLVRRALGIQAAFAFGLPLAVGLAHSAFALAMLHTLMGFAVLGSGLIVAAFAALAFFGAGALAAARQESALYSETERNAG